MKRFYFAIAGMLLFQFVHGQDAHNYAASITAEALKEKLSIIASPEMEGRESATLGQQKASAYIEEKFRQAGLLPGTAGGYQMSFPIYQDTLLDISFRINKQALQPQVNFYYSMSQLPAMFQRVNQIVFAPQGLFDTARLSDDKLAMRDKWVVVPQRRAGSNMEATSTSSVNAMNQAIARFAASKGAKGLFIISSDFPKKAPAPRTGNKFLRPGGQTLPVLYISPAVAARLLSRSAGDTSGISSLPAGNYSTDVEVSVTKFRKRYTSTNVLGLLPGTDKKDEYVVLTAHYDHVGRQNGVIHPGADDDGSGTVAVLQMAEAFAKAKAEGKGPRRSIVFMAVSGEEMGLLGSWFYSENPLYPIAKTSVNLNIDMIGRITPDYKGDSANYVYVIGDDKLSSELAPLADSANRHVGLQLDRSFNGNDPQRFYFRSDHYNFARKGVPVIFYFNGTHADYHRPGDTVDKINFDLLSKRAKLVFYTAWIMANRENMLKRDLESVTGSR